MFLKKKIHLSFDIDWAPDWIIDDILNFLKKKKCKVTFFITHKSEIIKKIREDGHTIGIHPNFYKKSCQEEKPIKVVENLLNIAPDAQIMRTHRLFYDSGVFSKIFSIFKNLKYDCSLYTYKFPLIKKFKLFTDNVEINRINFNWMDYTALMDNKNSWNKINFDANLYFMNFHPILLFINAAKYKDYAALKKKFFNKKFYKLKKNEIMPFVNTKKFGTKFFFEEIINDQANHKFYDFKTLIKKINEK